MLFCAVGVQDVQAQAVETYRVKKSDTMQTVADRFGITVEELLEYNKDYRGRTLQARDVLIIPSKKQRKLDQLQKEQVFAGLPAETQAQSEPGASPAPVEFATHVVAPKETVYGISRRWGITQEQLKQYNPELETSVLKIGMSLRIPLNTSPDTLSQSSSLAARPTGTSAQTAPETERLVAAEPDRQATPAVEQTVSRSPLQTDVFAQSVPFPIKDSSSFLPVRELSVRRGLKVDVMLPLYLDRADSLADAPVARRLQDSQIGLGFYMGVLMALDSLAGQGLMADVRVFDTQHSVAVVDSLVGTLDFSQTDVVIGPLFAEVAEKVAERLKGHKAIVVSPLSIRHDVVAAPNILQVSAPVQDLQNAVLGYIRDNLPAGERVVIVASSTGQSAQLERIMRVFSESGITDVELLNTDLGENAVRLAGMLRQNANPTVLVPSLTASTVAEVYQAVDLSGRQEPVNVCAFEANSAAKKLIGEAQSQAASRVRYIYADRTFEQEGSQRYDDFVRAFRLRYREFPSTYSLAGFDITYDLLSRLAGESDNETAITSYPSQQTASRYRFIKYLDGGYVNTDAYILMHDTEHGTVLLR